MTLKEAIESGKPYKLPEQKYWTEPDYNGMFTREEVCREDWVLYEPILRPNRTSEVDK